MTAKKEIKDAALSSWVALNEFVMGCDDEDKLKKLLETEKKGRGRKQFMKRIHSRLNKVRADRERRELEK